MKISVFTLVCSVGFTFSAHAAKTKQVMIAPAGSIKSPSGVTTNTLPLEGSNSAIVCDSPYSDKKEFFLMLEGVRYNIAYPLDCSALLRDTAKMETVVTLNEENRTAIAYEAPAYLFYVKRTEYKGLIFRMMKTQNGLKLTNAESCGDTAIGGGHSGGCAEIRTARFLDVTFTDAEMSADGENLFVTAQGRTFALQKNHFTNTYFFSGFTIGQLQDTRYQDWLAQQLKTSRENSETIMQIRFDDLECSGPQFETDFDFNCHLGVTAYSCARGQCE